MKSKFVFLMILLSSLCPLFGENDSLIREEFRRKSVSYFEGLGYQLYSGLPLYSKDFGIKNEGFVYSSSLIEIKNKELSSKFGKHITVQPCARVSDFFSDKSDTLPVFHQLYIINNVNSNDFVENVIFYLRDVCHLDISKIAVVSMDSNGPYKGMEAFEDSWVTLGVLKENIYLRSQSEALITKSGDGYWQEDPDYLELKYITYSLYYPLKSDPGTPLNIETKFNWTEIGEFSTDDNFKGGAFGLERLEYLVLSLQFPDKKELHKELQRVKKIASKVG